MQPLIKQFIPVAALIAASAACGQTVITDTLDANSPANRGLPRFLSPPDRCSGFVLATGPTYQYGTHTIFHTGGILDVKLELSGPHEFSLGIHSDEPDDWLPSCASAVAYTTDESSAQLSLDLPTGTYTLVANTSADSTNRPYTLTYKSLGSALASVPAAGLPALAFTSLGLIGAAGFVTRRRKAKSKKA